LSQIEKLFGAGVVASRVYQEQRED